MVFDIIDFDIERKRPMKIENVYFDCWDTLVEFHCEDIYWNIRGLINHCINKEEVDFKEVHLFCEDFFKKYYSAHLLYELRIEQILSLFVSFFSIRLDCSIEQCSHEILSCLSPVPVSGIDSFLTFLEQEKIPYGCLSNTVYSKEDTMSVVSKLLPNHVFSSFEVSSDFGVKKPNPLFFQSAIKKSNGNIQRSMYIGDKLFQDAYGSYRAGFTYSVFLDWKNEKKKQEAEMKSILGDFDFPHIEISSYKELQRMLKDEIIEPRKG